MPSKNPENTPETNPGQVVPQPDWADPLPERLSRPTYWPAVLAFGIFLIFLGVPTSWIVSAVGLILFGLAIGGWIGEIRRES
jgi:hypothetical protein